MPSNTSCPAVHHADAVGDREQAIEIARDHHDGRPDGALLAPQQIEDLLRGHRIEPRGGLVVEHDGRARRGRARDADALLLPSAQARGHALLEARQGHAREPLGDARADLVLGRGVEAAQREGDVVEDREVVEERVVLEEHPDALADVLQGELRSLGDRVVADPDRARDRACISPAIILSKTLLPLAPGPMSP